MGTASGGKSSCRTKSPIRAHATVIQRYDILCHTRTIDNLSKVTYYVIWWYFSMKIEGIQARINPNGRIVIPAVIRKGMGLELGDDVLMSLEDGILLIQPQKARARRVPESRRQLVAADRVIPNELIAERREEAPPEAEDWLG
jgi:AbrB family looped-hinge helix DNA binding protein